MSGKSGNDVCRSPRAPSTGQFLPRGVVAMASRDAAAFPSMSSATKTSPRHPSTQTRARAGRRGGAGRPGRQVPSTLVGRRRQNLSRIRPQGFQHLVESGPRTPGRDRRRWDAWPIFATSFAIYGSPPRDRSAGSDRCAPGRGPGQGRSAPVARPSGRAPPRPVVTNRSLQAGRARRRSVASVPDPSRSTSSQCHRIRSLMPRGQIPRRRRRGNDGRPS